MEASIGELLGGLLSIFGVLMKEVILESVGIMLTSIVSTAASIIVLTLLYKVADKGYEAWLNQDVKALLVSDSGRVIGKETMKRRFHRFYVRQGHYYSQDFGSIGIR